MSSVRKWFVASGLMLMMALVGAPAGATLVRGYSLPAMISEAHAVVRGEVVDEEVVYDARWGRVYTHSVVRVVEALAGRERAGALIVVRQVGGELDGIESRVVGTARLELGAEVVLFTRTDGALHYLVGMAQGAFEVRWRPGGLAALERATGGLALMAAPGPARAMAPDGLTLEQLRQAVRAGARP